MAINEPDLLARTVQQAASGDEYAFARTVAAHHDDMCRVAYVVCRDADLAQEAVQEAGACRCLSTTSSSSSSAGCATMPRAVCGRLMQWRSRIWLPRDRRPSEGRWLIGGLA